MKMPTRKDVEKAIHAGWRNTPFRNGNEGPYPIRCDTESLMVDSVMALLEDKPTPKWEEEFETLFCAGAVPSLVEYKDFIREKLREFGVDCGIFCWPLDVTQKTLTTDEIRKKWGL